jgi:hypothetical protein
MLKVQGQNHKEHAGNVEEYSEPHPITKDVSNMTEDNVQ